MNFEKMVKLISDIAKKIKYRGLMLNERYLHHYFSHSLQSIKSVLNLFEGQDDILLHPEWPTYKKQTNLENYGRYKKNKDTNKYEIHPEGTAGFVDFAIGKYKKPDIGIEFSLKYGWSHEEVIYDFVKLLDTKNPFKSVISFNVIFRNKSLVKGKNELNLTEHINRSFFEAKKRLKENCCDNSRSLFFLITEIDSKNNRRHWYFNHLSNEEAIKAETLEQLVDPNKEKA